MEDKITFLSLIHEHKDILFGKFCDVLTHEVKTNKWKEITSQLTALGIFHKDWKYLRDTTWQNFRKRTMEKKDNRTQTGSGGGKKCKYHVIDEMVLKIIGKDSPVIEGLSVPESSGSNNSQISIPVSTENNPLPPPPLGTPNPLEDRPRRKSTRITSSKEPDLSDNLMDIKKEKLKVELELSKEKLEIAKRERHKLDLEILKLEKELNIQQPSNFTLPFYLQYFVLPSDSEETEQDRGDILQQAINNSFSTQSDFI